MSYPLGYDSEEVERLKKQFQLLYPQELSGLIKNDDHVLDVGSGSGDLLSILPDSIQYTGIDLKDVVRDIYKSRSNVKVVETDFLNWQTKEHFSFVNLRLILWSVSNPDKVLAKALSLSQNPQRFFIYEPDDRGLEFSTDLSCIGDLARNWREEISKSGKDPFIGGKLCELLISQDVTKFEFKEKVFMRSGSQLDVLKKAARNLVGIFSKYPNSESLSALCNERIDQAGEASWYQEKYCYAYK
jgi:SAM-dependent methyltransferase